MPYFSIGESDASMLLSYSTVNVNRGLLKTWKYQRQYYL